MNNERYMQQAIALARRADGWTHPNPMVGAVVVRRDRIVGEGYHRLAGLPHAEVKALRQAGRRARGADLYVTLEPCAHHGRTPPCTEAIMSSGVRRVIYGMRDPHPKARGAGLRALRRAGIAVIGPVGEAACRALNPAFIHWATTRTPYVIAKVGSSLDGKIADAAGRSRWITNAAARAYGHRWRARVDGIGIGLATLRADDPRLTVRLRGYDGPQPQPIVFVSGGPIPRRRHLVRAGPRRPVLFVVPPAHVRDYAWLTRCGHELVPCPIRRGRFDLRVLLRSLGRRGMTTLLVEGGAATLAGFFRAGRVRHAVIGLAPILLGSTGKGWTEDFETPTLATAPKLDIAAIHRFGDNIVVEGEVRCVHRNY